jgi:hypothetical protein
VTTCIVVGIVGFGWVLWCLGMHRTRVIDCPEDMLAFMHSRSIVEPTLFAVNRGLDEA